MISRSSATADKSVELLQLWAGLQLNLVWEYNIGIMNNKIYCFSRHILYNNRINFSCLY